MRREYTIYLIGVILLGLGYEWLKRALGESWLFVAVVVSYLLLIRVVGRWAVRRWPETSE